jgi:hypothetical protein
MLISSFMDKTKATVISVGMVCFTVLILGLTYIYHQHTTKGLVLGLSKDSLKESVKDKELDIGLHDQYTYCIRSVMKESRLNSKPCDATEAERICGKLRKES